MKWIAGISIFSALSLAAFAQDQLPQEPEPNESDIEPPLLIGNELPEPPPAETAATAESNRDSSVEQLEKDLARAQKSAAAGPHLYRIGVIAKVDMEDRALKVVRLEAKIDITRAQNALEEFAAQCLRFENGEISLLEFAAAPSALAMPLAKAETSAAALKRAEMDAAVLNLQRQQKLLAAGVGRKSDVHRAEEKIATLKQEAE
ncbi:MAG: hypothetical protein QOI04_1684 [Verrucomicrobiota bacterium]